MEWHLDPLGLSQDPTFEVVKRAKIIALKMIYTENEILCDIKWITNQRDKKT
jgi:hypothetical protein